MSAAVGRPAYQYQRTAEPVRDRPAGILLIGATIGVGLMAGLYFAFDVAVMPGLAQGDDLTYVTAMQNINEAIENGLFGLLFVGAFIATGVAAFLQNRLGRHRIAAWAWAALVGYGLMLMITMGVNIPLNNELAQAGDPAKISDPAAVRENFENLWRVTNALRTLVCTAALGCLARALVLHGRARHVSR